MLRRCASLRIGAASFIHVSGARANGVLHKAPGAFDVETAAMLPLAGTISPVAAAHLVAATVAEHFKLSTDTVQLYNTSGERIEWLSPDGQYYVTGASEAHA
eukprot:TRINITY_DN17258_c0_g1_i1.p4 TRINITY_DN17258_c0_g1~~TRINITY_DN17258_c0_g1_i1.p4  ORF type:complete len:102 (+),score=34.69 TRINITY_DN17258_c0_g1_i1:104-409(+)